MVADVAPRGSKVTAVLGPTNTGKTHLAMERLLGHESGMIGFPLRLLARENYDRAVREKGVRRVALITGEEKIVPPEAQWFLCTVESMPVDRDVAFLGVDEIQMCADPDRGHLFTDRLLHARGRLETMFMGAETIRPLLRRLVPEAEYVSRPRFSSLACTGPCKLTRLPPRSALVAFSVADVYSMAELIRRQRGGTAIVLGALSPRTRNAQVAMYQAGEVDYLVATDAIGMGLNMHVDHVAFAATRKFDGRGPRPLTAAEMAQIAGRAGRFTKNGTFGTTAEAGPLDPELVERIEAHRFEPLTTLKWRNSELQFVSLAALKTSLARRPQRPGLMRVREADDELALAHLTQDSDIVAAAQGHEAVSLLWDVCCIPDFGKVTGEGHARLLSQIYSYLTAREGERRSRLPTDWVARQVDRINRTDGDIEALMQRIAGVRTWTYIAHRGSWLSDAEAWQQRTRAIEDKLSDALHERLIQRFVDRRTASLLGRMQERQNLVAAVRGEGEVLVEGHFVGTLQGFRFVPDPAVAASAREAGRSVLAAATRALGEEIRRRVERLVGDDDTHFGLDPEFGCVTWRGDRVARLFAGPTMLAPRLEPLASDLLGGDAKMRVRARLTDWLQAHVRRMLAPVFQVRDILCSGAARGLVFELGEHLGSIPRRQAHTQIAALTREDRAMLSRAGLRLGRESVYFPRLLKPAAMRLRASLWAIQRGLPAPQLGAKQSPAPPGLADAEAACFGHRVVAGRLMRIDALEHLAAHAARLAREATAVAAAELPGLCGDAADAKALLAAIGFRVRDAGEHLVLVRDRQKSKSRDGQPRPRPAAAAREAHSPFAALTALRQAR